LVGFLAKMVYMFKYLSLLTHREDRVSLSRWIMADLMKQTLPVTSSEHTYVKRGNTKYDIKFVGAA
jgi:hypothetical protein